MANRILLHEHGQSVVIMAGALFTLMALLALVVDSGHAYVQRRIIQNATDAATLAGGTELVMTKVVNGRYAGSAEDEQRIWQAVVRVAQANGIPDSNGVPNDAINDNIEAYFVGPDFTQIPGTVALPNNDGITVDKEIVGVKVESTKRFDTYFATLLGFDRIGAGAAAVCIGPPTSGPSEGSGLFPVAVSHSLFQGEGGANVDEENSPVIGKEYQIFEKDLFSSFGNFGWLTWDTTQSGGSPSNATLAANINDTDGSGVWHVGDWVPGATGVQVSNNVRSALDARIADEQLSYVVVPIYDTVREQGSNFEYRISGFAKFKLNSYSFSGGTGNKWIKATAVQWINSAGEAGGGYYGGGACKLHPPIEKSRKIVGTVYLNELIPQESTTTTTSHVPVDAMMIMDTSGSMLASWSGGATKLQSAKDALTLFNSKIQPDESDRVGLTTFPYKYSTDSYTSVCGASHSFAYGSTLRSRMTGDIVGVNATINALSADGGTPLAHGIMRGREQLLTDLNPDAVPVIIIASDGIVNVTLDDKWTGFSGNAGEGQNTPACNNQAEQQTIDQATLAKESGITVFSIAIGDGFNTDVLRAIATPDSDTDGDGDIETHFFKATNEQELLDVYDRLATRIETIGHEGTLREQQTLARNAHVTLANSDTGASRTVMTNDAGTFAFTDIEPGRYQLTARVQRNGLWYDIPTDGYGGPELNPAYVEIEISSSIGATEPVVMFLKTDDLQ